MKITKRNLQALAGVDFDIVVVGGGIVGACVAWDATLRGLRVALIERADFGGATSANSLKVIHGGLRYLQDANLGLVRNMIQERRAFLRIAPHLVHPLSCVMPTYRRSLFRGKLVLGLAIRANDFLGFDRNRGLSPTQRLPGSRILSREESTRLLPGLASDDLTGAVQWHDAQVYNSERLLLSFVLSAQKKGAFVANYVVAEEFFCSEDGTRVTGVAVKDRLSGARIRLSAKCVVNATGPWAVQLSEFLDRSVTSPQFQLVEGINLVTRQIHDKHALGLNTSIEGKTRALFIVPWRQYSLVGTLYLPHDGAPDCKSMQRAALDQFLGEVNEAYPALHLTWKDVYHIHYGLLPALFSSSDSDQFHLIRTDELIDHAAVDALEGIVTAVGVKYTSALHLAERTVDLIFAKLQRESPPCLTRSMPLHDADGPGLDRSTIEKLADTHNLSPGTMAMLLRNYGAAYRTVLSYVDSDVSQATRRTSKSAALRAQVIHAVRSEMAWRLADVVLRRTETGSAGVPPADVLESCIEVMSAEFDWGRQRIEAELDHLYSCYPVNDLT